MEGKLLARAAEFLNQARNKKRWTKAVTALAAVVVFGTTYALILPAITLQAECGQEGHAHTEACYTVTTVTPQPTMLCSAETLELHQHDEDCYDEDDELICGCADFVVHEHDENCYDLDGKLICTLPEIEEHEHDEDCYETERVLLCDQAEVEAHTHGEGCYDEDGTLTCDREETEGHRHGEDCYRTETVLVCDELEVEVHEHDEDCYEEIDGQQVLTCGKLQVLAHQHDATCIQPPEGDPYEVTTLTCGKEAHQHDENCYLTVPPAEEAPDQGEEPVDEEEPPEEAPEEEVPVVTDPEEARTMTFPYEQDGVMIDFTVRGALTLPDGAAADEPQEAPEEAVSDDAPGEDPDGAAVPEEPVPADPWQQVQLSVVELDETTDLFDRFLTFALENGGNDTLYNIRALEVHFLYDGVELDTSDWEITAEVKLTQEMMTPPEDLSYMTGDGDGTDETEAGAIAPEAEVGVVVSLFQADADEVTQLDSVLLQEGEETPALRVSVKNGVLALTTSTTANPKFTVQYYAYLDVAATAGQNSLDIIDTSGGYGQAKLPNNYSSAQSSNNAPSPATVKNIYLTEADNGKYKVATDRTLCEVYKTRNCEYIKQPNLTYFNSLYENGHYKLQKIWVRTDGDTSADASEDGWTQYDPTIHFTNREASATGNTILITENTVIRLVFETTNSTYTNDVTFYDYDITNDGAQTAAQGINSAENYVLGTAGGVKLAFGNNNTDTGLGVLSWNNDSLNMYNTNGFNGCTFGLVTGLSADGTLQYASGVAAPNLFNDGEAKGKTSYTKNVSLQFDRVGDTYTLSGANAPGNYSLSGLQYFNHPGYGTALHTHIWTNNFWPMDKVTNTDPHTGATGNTGTYTGATKTSNYPVSDDGLAHNNMFGMHYAVNFTLTADYSGPLEYLFFGDDDMWVFLDDQLVCDIGGVHSSVGEYVNLWDYIAKGSSGSHTLTFFYTERGLSGSTCYMQFTLPSVSSITPEQNTDTLRVEKQVDGPDSGEGFHFSIHLKDENGTALKDDYSYTRYNAKNEIVEQDVIAYDGGSFELKHGEYIIIKYLPLGTQYEITETKVDGYSTTVTINGGQATPGETASGSIEKDREDVVKYVNKTSYALPSTGGPGTSWLLLGGAGLMALALWQYHRKREYERRNNE